MKTKAQPRSQIKPGDKVEVFWEDAYGTSGWDGDPEDHTPYNVRTLGYVVFKDTRGIKLAHGSATDGPAPPALGVTFIPKGMIRSIVKFPKATRGSK
jgi:hypothetical protein